MEIGTTKKIALWATVVLLCVAFLKTGKALEEERRKNAELETINNVLGTCLLANQKALQATYWTKFKAWWKRITTD